MDENFITIDIRKHPAALQYAANHHTSVQTMVENYLSSFYEEVAVVNELSKMPPELQRLCGIASGLKDYRDPEDERFNYLMEKYK